MPELLVLGTAASVPDAEHDTLALALRGPGWAILIDCGGSPLHKLARLGVAREEVRAVVLTHYHADHLYGLPILVQGLWLAGRQESLPIYGPQQALERARQLLELFNLAERDDMFDLEWHPIALRQRRRVVEMDGVAITASPVDHADTDTVALRFEELSTGRAIVYSADTEPVQAVVDLAVGAGLLIHEATGEGKGHSSPEQAAQVAREAGVVRLALIHYPVPGTDLEAWQQRAAGFGGDAFLAQDGDVYPL
jgi:ribonuclease Z